MSNKIDDLIQRSIQMVENEVSVLEGKQSTTGLDRFAQEGLLSLIKTMIDIRKDFRLDLKAKAPISETMSEEDYEAAILAEADAIRAKNA